MRLVIKDPHVIHLLPRYATGQLRPRQAQRVYQHLRRCETCLSRAIEHEQAAGYLNDKLRFTGKPGAETLNRIWEGISLPGDPPIPTVRIQTVSLPSLTAILLITLSLAVTSYSPVTPHPLVQVANTPAQSQPIYRTTPPIAATQPMGHVTGTDGAPTPPPDAVTTPTD